MKKLFLSLWLIATSAMAYDITTVNIGTTNNDGTGDTLRAAFGKINTNFTSLTNLIGITSNYVATAAQTNFISGLLYTNLSGRPQSVFVTAILTNAAVAGQCAYSWKTSAQGGTLAEVSTVGGQTLGTTLAETNKWPLYFPYVSNGAVYCLTSSITGAGNAVGIVPGSGTLITY